MAKKYKPLSLELIDEGRFSHQLENDLGTIQEKLIEFLREYKDNAKGAEAKLAIAITLKIADPKDEQFIVKATSKITTPSRPASLSLAISEVTENDQMRLFVRASGSDESSPRQGKLCTGEGESIDPDTGEVVKKPATA